MINKKKHDLVIKRFYKKYESQEGHTNEFTWDGPSDWDLWENSDLRIMFLVKEARGGFHPSVKGQNINNKLSRNFARWKELIKSCILDKRSSVFMPSKDIEGTNDDICIVEVKKLNEEKATSNNAEIITYAMKDKELLKEQINAIDPQIVFCCNTIESYDIIYDCDYQVEEKLNKVEKCSLWLVDNRFVIDFYHPSTTHMTEKLLFELLAKLLLNQNVQKEIPRILK